MQKTNWLKKYTTLEHLEKILKDKQLHLGNPGVDWDDKNDSECIQRYSKWRDGFKVRATCLTNAQDRFHFWHIFGKREKGVCLWFKRESLLRDIEKDPSLVSGVVEYPNRKGLSQIKPDQLPFTKREQYADECEFRVLRVEAVQHINDDKFVFSAQSLKRIYLNPWLTKAEVKREKLKILNVIERDFPDIRPQQNRSLRKNSWINAVSECIKSR